MRKNIIYVRYPISEIGLWKMVRIVIENASYIFTMDSRRRIIKNGAVAIDEGRIVAIGKNSELERAFSAEYRINARDRLVMPGLINSHVHTVQQLGRGLMDNVDSSSGIMWTYESELTDDDKYVSALLACLEMIKTGTTCFADPGANQRMDPVVRAARESGLRAKVARSTMDIQALGRTPPTPARLLESTEDGVREAEDFFIRFSQEKESRVSPWFSIRVVRAARDELCRCIKDLADKYKAQMHIHASASKQAVKSCKDKFGYTPVERLDKLGILGNNLLITHMNWLTKREMTMIKDHCVKICHCPTTGPTRGYGTYVSGKFWEMLQHGLVVTLGSDGAPTSNFLDMVRVMSRVTVHRDFRLDATIFPAQTVLEMASINAARALMLEKEIGSLERGKKADVVLFDLKSPEFIPHHDILSNLVHSACGHNAVTSIVDGEIIMENRKVKTINEEKLMDKAERAAEELRLRMFNNKNKVEGAN